MNRKRVWMMGVTAIMLFAGFADQTVYAQRYGYGGGSRGGWGMRGGNFGGYPGNSLGFGIGIGNGGRNFGSPYGYGQPYNRYRYPYGGYGNGLNYNQTYYNQPFGTQAYSVQPYVTQPYQTIPAQPYTTTQTYYAQPGQSAVSPTSYVPQASDNQTFDGGEIVLFSNSDTPNDLQYSLNGVPYQMKPNSVQRFSNDRTWTIEFQPTVGAAVQRFTLATGRYKFKPGDNGVALVQTQDQPASGTEPAATSQSATNP